MDAVRRLNHWVPASYLAAFTDNGTKDGLLHPVRRDSARKLIPPLPPRASAKERDLYVAIDADGALDDSIERMLAAHIEGPFIPVRNALVYGPQVGITGTLDFDSEEALAFFIALQQIRTPKFREQFNLMAAFGGNLLARARFQNLKQAKADLEETVGRPVTIDEVIEIRDDLERGNLLVEPNDKLWLAHGMKLAMDLKPVIRSLPRRILRTPPGINLITNDAPVVLVRRMTENEYKHGGGWLAHNVEVTLPLSPTTLLVLGFGLDSFGDQGSAEWWRQVRHRLATGADQWVFASAPDPEAANWLWTSRAPKHAVEYPGGKLQPGQSAYAAVRDMM